MRTVCAILSLCGAALLGVCASEAQETQTAPVASASFDVAVDSGLVSNTTDELSVVYTTTVQSAGAPWLRLAFDKVLLAGDATADTESFLEITSLQDGGTQILDEVSLRQWRHTSAYFNGDAVRVNLWARPGTGFNRLVMTRATAGTLQPIDRSICGPVDDRTLSNDQRVARVLPVGCTVWLIDDCNKCFITAGHCQGNMSVVQFNVPLSSSTGGLNHPPPEDQYSVDPASLVGNGGQGVGNDWAYFGVFENSTTGLSAGDAQGEWFTLAMPQQPQAGDEIRITGNGSVSPPVPLEWYLVQKTHVGPYFAFTGSRLQYQTDTTGGNSGSPVIFEPTGEAIGVHTHAGCGPSSGNNGTGLNHTAFQAALADPQGVCRSALDFTFPGGLPDQVDPDGGDVVQVVVGPDGDVIPQSGTGMFHYDLGSGFQSVAMVETSPNMYEATFPAVPCLSTVEFYFSADSTEGTTYTSPSVGALNAYDALSAEGEADLVAFDFEDTTGWTPTAGAGLLDGAWEAGVPVGGGDRNDPPTDFDGSGQCFLTDNVDGDSDVDGGPANLISPTIDLSSAVQPTLHVAVWVGTDNDSLIIQQNSGGLFWTTLATVGATAGWQELAINLTPGTSNLRLRFRVSDDPDDSITECAIDAFRIVDVSCVDDCLADFNGDGVVNTGDVLAFLNAYSATDPAADWNGDGFFNTSDVIGFLNVFAAGC